MDKLLDPSSWLLVGSVLLINVKTQYVSNDFKTIEDVMNVDLCESFIFQRLAIFALFYIFVRDWKVALVATIIFAVFIELLNLYKDMIPIEK